MAKTGFARIGFINNMREYPQLIREKAGIGFYDYNEFNEHINGIWDARDHGLICFDRAGSELPADSDQLSSFLIDTGFTHQESQGVLYAQFIRSTPGRLDDYGWMGVKIGSREEIMGGAGRAEGFEGYTSVNQQGYQAIARVINDLAATDLNAETCAQLLKESFDAACSEDALAVVVNEYDSSKKVSIFPIRDTKTADGTHLFIKMEKNANPNAKTEWYGAFVITEPMLKDELLSFYCFHMGDFVFKSLTEANSFYNKLAAKAMKENWKWSDAARNESLSQPILKSYIEFTYYRLKEETAQGVEKIIHYRGKVYFNTGLLDRNFRQIIIVGDLAPLKRTIPGLGECCWDLLENVQPYSHNEQEIARMFNEDEVPGMASYFTDYRQVVFDASLDIHTNDNHIFEDGVARGRLPKYQEEYLRVKDNEMEKELLLTRIARDFDSAKERAKLMAERNYKLAIPQFWKETGEIQFLLPIYLGEREEAEKPQCALVLSLDESGRRPYYRGETILTLDMAYNNARLIAKPDVFWLNDLV